MKLFLPSHGYCVPNLTPHTRQLEILYCRLHIYSIITSFTSSYVKSFEQNVKNITSHSNVNWSHRQSLARFMVSIRYVNSWKHPNSTTISTLEPTILPIPRRHLGDLQRRQDHPSLGKAPLHRLLAVHSSP